MLLMIGVRMTIISSTLLLPQFLSAVQGFRPVQTGPALLATVVPQLAYASLAAVMLRRIDARIMLASGLRWQRRPAG